MEKNFENIENLEKQIHVKLRELLSEKRYTHSINVAEKCRELSKMHGLSQEDSNKAYIAGLIHDIAKKLPDDVLERMVRESKFEPDTVELTAQKLWHSVAGAEYITAVLNINDYEIVNAVRYHTVARAEMTAVEKIVYIADKISADRDYEGVDDYRRVAGINLDWAMCELLKRSIGNGVIRGKRISMHTFKAYNYYVQKSKDME